MTKLNSTWLVASAPLFSLLIACGSGSDGAAAGSDGTGDDNQDVIGAVDDNGTGTGDGDNDTPGTGSGGTTGGGTNDSGGSTSEGGSANSGGGANNGGSANSGGSANNGGSNNPDEWIGPDEWPMTCEKLPKVGEACNPDMPDCICDGGEQVKCMGVNDGSSQVTRCIDTSPNDFQDGEACLGGFECASGYCYSKTEAAPTCQSDCVPVGGQAHGIASCCEDAVAVAGGKCLGPKQ